MLLANGYDEGEKSYRLRVRSSDAGGRIGGGMYVIGENTGGKREIGREKNPDLAGFSELRELCGMHQLTDTEYRGATVRSSDETSERKWSEGAVLPCFEQIVNHKVGAANEQNKAG